MGYEPYVKPLCTLVLNTFIGYVLCTNTFKKKKKITLPTDSSTSTLCQLNSNNPNTDQAYSCFGLKSI
jgi:hypothetical protein